MLLGNNILRATPKRGWFYQIVLCNSSRSLFPLTDNRAKLAIFYTGIAPIQFLIVRCVLPENIFKLLTIMRYSTKTRYGLRLLNYLSHVYFLKGPDHFTQLTEVAHAEDISFKYLEQIVRVLKPLNILESARGMKGGYRLSASPHDFPLNEIFNCLEGNTHLAPCLDCASPCPRSDVCEARLLWVDLEEYFQAYLKNKTLADMTRLSSKKAMHPGPMMMRETA